MKKVLRAALSGVYLSALTFLVFMIIKGFRGGQEITYSAIDMAYSCIAVIIIGLGFGIPSLIYETELPTLLKVLIHMGTGIIVMLITSVVIGWIDFSRGWLPCLLIALIQIALAFLLWFLSCVKIRRDAKEMNKKIAEKQ
jgi:hypothetical protein